MVHRAPPLLLAFSVLLGGAPAFATDAALTPDPGLAVEEALKPRKVTVVRVDKSERRMWLIAGNSLVKTYQISLGGNPTGHKVAEGDKRTPEGRYVIDWENPTSVAYRSMHISYPNKADRERARQAGVSPGGNIMIHGQYNGYGWASWLMQRFDWTSGCIAVTNAEMDEIISLVAPGTPIEITP